MNRIFKPIQAALLLMALAALSSCALGQVAQPTATAVDVNAIKTAAAATAIFELTRIAGQASATPAPTRTPTAEPTQAQPSATQDLSLLSTATLAAGSLPATVTPVVAATGGTPGITAIPSLTPIGLIAPTSNAPTCLNSKFIADITIPDGTVLKPYEKFYKVWRIQNTGLCPWDQGYGLTIWAGPNMSANPIYFSNRDQKVEPGGIVDLGLEMRAPPQPGDYVAHWTMISDTYKTFGGDLTVAIKVVP